MKLTPIASNMTEVITKDACVLFSYSTPVAARTNGMAFRTEKFWSKTTSRHINKWLDGQEAREVPQSYLDQLV